MRHALSCLIAGVGFGFVLGWARLTEPDTIYNMLRLREPDVFLLMGSAIVTGAAGVRLLRGARARTLVGGEPVSWKTLPASRDHVVGSMLFGLGWSLACTCPGPTAAMIGRGQWAGLFTALGIFSGIALRDAHRARAKRLAAESAPRSEPALAAGAEGIGL
ncbi:MAG: DUF6691 family protein [Candidatus Eiseniibacteriota bacterium]